MDERAEQILIAVMFGQLHRKDDHSCVEQRSSTGVRGVP